MSIKKTISATQKRGPTADKHPHKRSPSKDALRFVIHKHASHSLHYDFRLEDEGVLKSWAIPKGPSTDPHKKQLAIETEDHPLTYATFEGVIPQGSYGAGTVIIWDSGTFSLIKDMPFSTSFKKGEILFTLAGKKLHGNYALIKTDFPGNKSWLLIKMQDDKAQPGRTITEELPKSVLSGKTIEQLREEKSDS